MSKTARRVVREAADKALPVNKAFGCSVDRDAVIDAWLPFAERLHKGVRRMEKSVDKLDKSVQGNKKCARYISDVNARALAVDAKLLSSVENMVHTYSEEDIQAKVENMVKRNKGDGRSPFELAVEDIIREAYE
jgi:hypothetical protein